MKQLLKSILRSILLHFAPFFLSAMRRVVSFEERIRLYLSEIKQTTGPEERTRIFLSEMKQSLPPDTHFKTLLSEVDQLLPPEERYLLPSFARGYGKETDRFSYQRIWGHFDIKPHEKVLDIGSGGYPFPYATHLADLYEGETGHRAEPLVKDGRPFRVVDIENMPYDDHEFDFVYCSHVLEHVSDPARACEELMRIGKRGYIETPTRMSDIMLNFCHLKEHHIWYIVMAGDNVFFFEWDERERKDTGCIDFFKMYHSDYSNPFQTLVHTNRNLFVNMMFWNGKFHYYVFNKMGDLVATNTRM